MCWHACLYSALFVVASTGVVAATMSASTTLTVAVQADGTLWGWGSSPVGDGTAVSRLTPVRVDSSRDWREVTAGERFALAIRSDGSLWGWGGSGTLPTLLASNQALLSPTRIGTDNDWLTVSAGNSSATLIKRDGSLWLWGSFSYGPSDYFNSPTKAMTPGVFTAVSAGATWSYGLRDDGTLWQFGTDEWGQGGTGLVGRLMPTANGSSWRSISTIGNTQQTYAIAESGSLWAWGRSSAGTLGFGDDIDHQTPTLLNNDTTWAAIGAKIGLKGDGTLWSWASARYDGPTLPRPHQIGIGQSWAAVSTTLAKRTDGMVHRVGVEYEWTGGRGMPGRFAEPKLLDASSQRWSTVAAGDSFAFAVNTDGTLWGWGWVPYPPSGWNYSPEPALFDASTQWQSLAAGAAHTLAIKSDGSLWGWGENSALQLGFAWINPGGTYSSTPQRVGTATDWTQVVASSSLSAGIRSSGTLWRWGGWIGFVGSPIPPANYAPSQVGNDADWVQVAFLFENLVARKADGRLFRIDGATATQIGQDADWAFVGATRDGRYIAQKSDGKVFSWSDLPAGYTPNPNASGVLGDGTTIHRTTPTYIATTRPLVAAVGDSNNTQLIDNAGTRTGWASLLGLGGGMGVAYGVTWTPFSIQPARQWSAVSQGVSFTVGIADGGKLYAWEKPPAMTTLTATGFTFNPKTAVIGGAPVSPVDVVQFNGLTVGEPAAPRNLTLTNSGDLAIQITQIVLDSPFTLSHNCPGNLVAGASCDVQIGIVPITPGIEFARLRVDADAQVSTNNLQVWAIASDNVPEPFAFSAVTGAEPGTWQYAVPALISGLSNATSARANNGGAVAINCTVGTPVWSSSVVIRSGETLCVRHRASPIPGAQTSTIVTVGTLASTFSVTTRERTPGALVVSGGYGQTGVFTWGICTSLPPSQAACWATDTAYACEVQPGATGTIHNRDARAFAITNLQTDLQKDVTRWPTGTVSSCRLDIDGDGLLLPDKDGIAWLKYLSGYATSNFLVEGPAATCAANTSAYWQGQLYVSTMRTLGLAADEAVATQFGLVLLRAMLGLTGNAATTGTSIRWDYFISKVDVACGTNFGSGG